MINELKPSNGKLITKSHPKSPISEAFRALRTSIHFSGPKELSRLMLITSPGPEDGKSLVTSNLGVVMAQAGNKVLIVDADLRRPSQHKLFGIDGQAGLTNILVEKANSEELVQPGGVDGLDVLPSGPIPPNPSEILASEQMKRFLEFARDRYEYVLVDSPPALAVTDAAILASLVNGIIIVIRAGTTRYEAARECKEILEKARGRIIGVVLNRVRYSRDNYRYYYYYSEIPKNGHGS